jgi:hypothetical protein
MARPAPAPDRSNSPTSRNGCDVLDVIYSIDYRERAVITADDRGMLRVEIDSWDTSDWEYLEIAYWTPTEFSLTDSLENARKLARETLGIASG